MNCEFLDRRGHIVVIYQSGHIPKCLLIELSRAGQENIYLAFGEGVRTSLRSVSTSLT